MDRILPLRVNGRFVNPGFAGSAVTMRTPEEGAQESRFRQMLRWRRERRKAMRAEKREARPLEVPRVATPTARVPDAPEDGLALTWVGHSTVLVQLDGQSYLTDPVWSRRIGGVVKRWTEPGIPMSALPRIDAVLQSHNHYDHLDAGTWAKLPKDTPIHCTTGVAKWFRKRGFRDITERSWWEGGRTSAGHVVTCVPAQHFSARTLWDRDRTLWGGWVVQGRRHSAYFAGDSGYFAGFRQIGEAFPGLDVGLIPIGAYAPKWFMAPVHVDPPEAGQAFLDCGARAMLPIHWGTFRLADERVDEPPGVLRAWWDEQKLDPARLLRPKMGETIGVR